jgi:hypothetical protein
LQDLGFMPSEKPDFFVRGANKRLDLVGDFAPSLQIQVPGKTWIELKIWREVGFESRLSEEEDKLKALLPRVQAAHHQEIKAVLLLVCKLSSDGRSAWSLAGTRCRLFCSDDDEWVTVAGGTAKAGRGMAPRPKMDILSLLNSLCWHSNPDGGADVAYFADFLGKLKIPNKCPGKRAKAENQKLKKAKHDTLLKQVGLDKPGQEPWVGTRLTLRRVYRQL